MTTRRALRHTLSIFAAWAIGFGAQAAAPLETDQVPGYYRMAVGGYVITALYDGYVDLPPTVLTGASAADVRKLLDDMYANRATGIQTAVNAYLVHDGKQLVLIDAGNGQCGGKDLGQVENNLKAAGYQTNDVDAILMTHLHTDHACGLINADGAARFPRADVYVPQAESAFWLSPAMAAQAPPEMKPFFENARKAVAPYMDAGKLVTYTADDVLPAGAKAVATPGHTPGHTAYLFGAGEEKILVWGDIVHNYAVQMARPEIALTFDVDRTEAIATRQQVFADASRDKLWIAGAHMPFPGLGHVRAAESGYTWIPTEFAPLRPAILKETR